MKRIAIFTLVLALGVPSALVAGATTKPKANPHATYAIGKAKKCRLDFVKKTEKHKIKGKSVRYVACVYRALAVPVKITPVTIPPVVVAVAPPAATPSTPTPTTQLPTPSYSYEAHVDPSFTQSPTNALAVSYTFSADAIQTLDNVKTDLGQTGNLPGGVLQLFSDGLLACSINIGGAVTGGQCPVTYSSFGTHQVVTTYVLSGITPVSETDPENILPYAPSLTPANVSCIDENNPLDGNQPDCFVELPVVLSGLSSALVPTGIFTLAGGALNEGCSTGAYSASAGTEQTECMASVPESCTATAYQPTVSFGNDSLYPSVSVRDSQIPIPADPALCPPV